MVEVTLIIFYFYSQGTQELTDLCQVMGLEPGCDPRKSGFRVPALKHYLYCISVSRHEVGDLIVKRVWIC